MIKIEPVTGWTGQAVHGERMTLVSYAIAAEAPEVREHHHPEEEVWIIIEGELAIRVDGEERILRPGEGAVIPSHARHWVRALKASRAIVIDSPARRQLPGTTPQT